MTPAIPFPDPPLDDGVVSLRGWRDEDAPVKAAWGADPVIVRWTGVPESYTAEAALEWNAQVEEERLAGRALSLAVVADAGRGRGRLRHPAARSGGSRPR